MVVPAAIVKRDERHAGLHEPPGEQRTLAEGIAAIGIADAGRLAGHVECGLGRLRLHQIVRLLIVLVESHRGVGDDFVERPLELVHFLPLVATFQEPFGG